MASGTTTDSVLAMLKEVTPELSCPVVVFSYFNPILRLGLADFTAAAVGNPSHTQHPLACRWRQKMRGRRRTQEEHPKWSCLIL